MKNKIKDVLVEKGISQKTLAGMIGMSEVGISKAINGSASKGTLEKVSAALGVPFSDLVDEPILYAKYTSDKTPLKFGDLEVACYVLNNGQRVFSGRGIQKAIGFTSKSGQWMNSFCNLPGLSTYLKAGDNSISTKLSNPIQFKRKDAGGSQSMTYGFEATLLVDICTAIIEADNAGDFNDPGIVKCAKAIIVAVAKTGIIALVDEATGYNQEKSRAKDELQKFLNAFLNEEASKWVKTFDDYFFEDLYKMHDWSWMKAAKKPGVVGIWINDLVYQRIGPMVLPELQERNPTVGNGHRKYKHHQFLSSDVGIPKLKKHIESLHTLAIASNYNWAMFKVLVNRVHPQQEQQLDLFTDFDF